MELKRRMTFDEMAKHMEQHTSKLISRVTVGLYAKSCGYKVYKPMVAGRLMFYYVNDSITEN